MNRIQASLWVLLAAVSYGLVTPTIKLGYEQGWMANQMTSSQLLMGAILLWLIIGIRAMVNWNGNQKNKLENKRENIREKYIFPICLGFFGMGFSTFCYNLSLTFQEGSIGAVWIFQYVWMTLLIESILQKKRPKHIEIFAVLLIWIGTWFAVSKSYDWDALALTWQGVLFGIFSALGYSLFIIGSSRMIASTDALQSSAIVVSGSLPWVLILIIFQGFTFPSSSIADFGTWIVWGSILAVLGHVLPTIGFQKGASTIGANQSAILGAMELPVAVFASALILIESVSWMQWFGVGIILFGVVLPHLKFQKGRCPCKNET